MQWRIREHVQTLIRDTVTRWVFGVAGIMLIGQWVGFLVGVPRHETFVPLHYTIYFGIDLTGPWWQAAWLPLASTVMWCAPVIGAGQLSEAIWRRAWATISAFIIGLNSVAMIMLLWHVWPTR